MLQRTSPLADPSTRRFAILILLIAICALTGGSSQPNMLPLLVFRPAMALGLGILLWSGGTYRMTGLWPLVAMLGTFAAIIALQLVPFSPDLWASMPGHARFAGAPVGDPAPWRPLSLTPDATIASLYALLPAAIILLGFAGLDDRHRIYLFWAVIAIGVASALLAVVQAGAGPDSPAFFYRQGDRGVPTGLLANRNHQALFLACCLPLLAVAMRTRRIASRIAWPLLASAGLAFIPLILLTGSRSGMVWGLFGAIGALFLMPSLRRDRSPRFNLTLKAVLAMVAFLLIGATVLAGRALSVERLLVVEDATSDMRVRAFSTVARITKDFFPFGTGFGSFDPVYRSYEPDAFLHPRYFNHAHNDLIELLMTGGLAAGLVLAAFLLWYLVKAVGAMRLKGRGQVIYLRRAAALIVALVLAASLTDYPLRTGIVTMLVTLACCWLAVPMQEPDHD